MKIGCYAFLVLTPLLLAAAPPTPEQYYAQALAVMRALPQPARVSMAATAVGRNIGVYVGPQKSEPKVATFVLGPGLGSTASWTERYDAASNTSLIDTKTAQSLSGARSLFDPTWYGAYDWLRYGFDGHRPASAQNAPAPDSQLKTIATLSVMAPGAYRISEGGAQQCPDGSPGHHLQMAARSDIDAHPLTDVTIDEHTMRICSFRFRIDKEHLRGGTGTVQLDYAQAGGYWLETHAVIEALGRIFGIGVVHAGADVTYRFINAQ